MISLLEFDVAIMLAIVGVILVSGLIHGTLGLGFPLVATPVLAAMMDVRSAILITLLPTIAVNIASIASGRQNLDDARRFLPLILFALIGSVAGATILATVDPAPFRLLLAGLILLYLWDRLRIPRGWLENHPLRSMAVFGIAAGFAAGTTNVMVAVLIVYFLSLGTARATMVPAMNACFLVGKASQIAVLALAGFVSLGLVIETTPLALAAVGALRLGQRLQARIELATYQRMLRWLLLLLALILVVQFLRETGLLPGSAAAAG